MEAYAAAYGIESGPHPEDSHFRQARFTSALSTLFDRATNFFREDDDTTLSADALPLLHALDDLHGLLSDAGDPRLELVVRSTRRDMLVELYALNRPELRPMFPVHPNVTVPEPWMAVVDAVAILEGWDQVSARSLPSWLGSGANSAVGPPVRLGARWVLRTGSSVGALVAPRGTDLPLDPRCRRLALREGSRSRSLLGWHVCRTASRTWGS